MRVHIQFGLCYLTLDFDFVFALLIFVLLTYRWSAIAARLPGRTDNEIKNYWNTHIRKRLLRMGIDPVTHSPRLDLLDLSSILSSSLYNSSQVNLSRLLGVQPLVNPEILRLASSLLSSNRENPNFLGQNVQENQMSRDVLQSTELPPLVQPNNQFDQTPIPEIPNCVPFSSEGQLMGQNMEQFSSDFTNFSSQNCQLNEWQSNGMASNLTQDYGPVSDYGYFESDQSIMDPPPSENSNFQSHDSNNFSFASVFSDLSTPSSSPTPLNSSSTYINSSSIATEDERESYCSNMMLKFEMPEMFGVSEFM